MHKIGLKRLPHAQKMEAKKQLRAGSHPSAYRDVTLFAQYWRDMRRRKGVGRPPMLEAA